MAVIMLMGPQQFINELKRRGVYRVAAIYSAGAWALLQLADFFFPLLGLPGWGVTAVLVVAAAGFPVALVFSWWFDLTPQGIIETPDVIPIPQRMQLSPRRLMEIVLVLALVSLVAYLYIDRLSSASRREAAVAKVSPLNSAQDRPSVAVMPFVSMSATDEFGYFGDGLAEEILNLLAKLNELNVAARTSSFYFKNKDVDIQQIARQLGVDYVLEGSVRREGQKIRVTAQLIEAKGGFHLWSETYDRTIDDVFSLQDEIASKVVESMQLALSEASRSVLATRASIAPQSYDYYLQGRAYLRRPDDAATLQSAASLFDRAIALAPDFADAYAGLCDSLLGLYFVRLDHLDFDKANKACRRALELDGQAVAVYVALGNLYRSSGDYPLAIQQFEAAMKLNPGLADAQLGLAETYVLENKPDHAEKAFLQAINLQPNYWRGFMATGRYLYNSGRVAEAVPYFLRITELMPESESALNNLGAAYYLLGDFESAGVAWQKSLQQNPSAEAQSNLASSMYFLGRYDEAIKLYHNALELAPEDRELWGNLGDSYRYSSQPELAVPMYEMAVKFSLDRLKVNPDDPETHYLLGHYYASLGKRELALAHLESAARLAPDNIYRYYFSATAYTALAEFDLAMSALEQAVALGYPKKLVSVDQSLAALKTMPRYQVLLTSTAAVADGL